MYIKQVRDQKKELQDIHDHTQKGINKEDQENFQTNIGWKSTLLKNPIERLTYETKISKNRK